MDPRLELPIGALLLLFLFPLAAGCGGAGGSASFVIPGGSAGGEVDFVLRQGVDLGGSFLTDALARDLDGDGLVDLVEADFAPHEVRVHRGEPRGGFTTVATLATAGAPWQLAAGDVDGDRRTDLAVVSLDEQGSGAAGLDLFLQDAGGGFTRAATLVLPFQPLDVTLAPASGRPGVRGPREILVADRDGRRVLSFAYDPSLGLVQGQALACDAAGALGHPISLAVLDAGGDGLLDLVAGEVRVDGAAGRLADRVTLWERAPTGWLPPRVLVSPCFGPLVQGAGDVDGDGREDLAVPQLGATRALLLRGAGADFEPPRGIECEGATSSLIFADLDGDGLRDVAATVLDRDTLAVRLATAPLVWGALERYEAGFAPRAAAALSLPGDRLPDVVCADAQQLSFLRGTGDGRLRSAVGYPTLSRGPITVRTADLDRDGDPDAVCMTALQTSIVFLENDGTGALAARSVVPLVESSVENYGHVAIADLDHDGLPEVLATVLQTDQLRVFRNTGTIAGFAQASAADTYAVGSRPTGLDVGDLDGDGRPDAICGNAGDRSVEVLRGLDKGRFVQLPAVPIGARPGEIRCADLDRDGDLDVVLTTGGEDTDAELLVLGGDGSGALEQKASLELDVLSASLEIGDLDGDGLPDLVVGQPGVSVDEVFVFLNRGGLAFERRPLPAGSDTGVVLIDDLDRDGAPDILLLSGTRDAKIAHGDGHGGFPRIEPMEGDLALPFSTQGASLADLDGDGLEDLLLVAPDLPLVWTARNASRLPSGP